MNKPSPVALTTSPLLLEGPDALDFAHAQFTSNVRALEPGHWQWSAWLDARGRVQFLFQLARLDEQALLLMPRGGAAADMAARLGRYVFRSRVTLDARPALALGSGAPLPAWRFEATDDQYRFGLGDRSLVCGHVDADDDWRRDAIGHGEAWLPDAYLDSLLPPALGLRRLGALSLDKGCFPGQEIAARLHYHGGHKYALAHLRLDMSARAGDAVLPTLDASEPVQAQVLDCVPSDAGHEALAVLHESALARLADDVMLVRRFAA